MEKVGTNPLQPVAVMSLLIGDIVLKARDTHPELPGHVIASAVSVIVGAIITFLGLFRLGWIVELISLSSVSAFVTGAAFTIACGQVRCNSRICLRSFTDTCVLIRYQP